MKDEERFSIYGFLFKIPHLIFLFGQKKLKPQKRFHPTSIESLKQALIKIKLEPQSSVGIEITKADLSKADNKSDLM